MDAALLGQRRGEGGGSGGGDAEPSSPSHVTCVLYCGHHLVMFGVPGNKSQSVQPLIVHAERFIPSL